MAKKNNEQYPSYHLHLTFKSISFAALIGFGGYSVYPGSSNGEEISGDNQQHILVEQVKNGAKAVEPVLKTSTDVVHVKKRSVLMENLLSYDEIVRTGIISSIVLGGFLLTFFLLYHCFVPTIRSNSLYIKQLAESIRCIKNHDRD